MNQNKARLFNVFIYYNLYQVFNEKKKEIDVLIGYYRSNQNINGFMRIKDLEGLLMSSKDTIQLGCWHIINQYI